MFSTAAPLSMKAALASPRSRRKARLPPPPLVFAPAALFPPAPKRPGQYRAGAAPAQARRRGKRVADHACIVA
jgi:hypothetical protein